MITVLKHFTLWSNLQSITIFVVFLFVYMFIVDRWVLIMHTELQCPRSEVECTDGRIRVLDMECWHGQNFPRPIANTGLRYRYLHCRRFLDSIINTVATHTRDRDGLHQLSRMPWLPHALPTRWTSLGRACNPWWRHQMETFSALLALCAGNSLVTGESPHKGQ